MDERSIIKRARLTRREVLKAAGFSTLAAFLHACGLRASELEAEQGEEIQLVYQDWRTDWFYPMVQEMLEQFHAENPAIRVFFTPDPEDIEESMLGDMRAGTAADVFQGCCSFFPIWAQEGFLLDLRPYVERDLDAETIAEWDPAQYNYFFTQDGLQYALPKYHGALALYYNKDLFDAYGVDYPNASWDHDDYLAAMKLLTHDLDGDGETDLWGSMVDISWERIQIHVNAWGGRFVDPKDPRICRMAEPEALEAMEWLRARMWDDRVMATFLDVQNMSTRQAFIAERIAMVEDGSWALKDILNGAEFRLGVAPFPAGPDRRVTLTTTDGFGIYVGTEHPEAAWQLLKFLIGKEYGRAMARANFLQPARVSLIQDWIDYVKDQFPDKASDMELNVFAEGQIQGYSVTAEIFANMAAARQLTYAAWEQIFTLGQAPVSLMETVSREIQAAQNTQG